MTDVVVCAIAFALVAIWYAMARSHANAFISADQADHRHAAHRRPDSPPMLFPTSDGVDWREHFTFVAEALTIDALGCIEAIQVVGRLEERPDERFIVTGLAAHIAWEYCLSSTVTVAGDTCTARFRRSSDMPVHCSPRGEYPRKDILPAAHAGMVASPSRPDDPGAQVDG